MEGHEMKDPAKWRVGTRFLNNPTGEEIWLHIDDGLMGGGEEIPYDEETSIQEFRDIYDQNFSDNRVGLFHYGVFGNIDNDDVDGYTRMRSDKFWISDANMDPRVKDQAQTFMHELGHSFGLNADNYWASKRTDIFGNPDDPIDDSVYPSVMRYGTMSVIDYSGEGGTVEVWEWYDSDDDGEEDSWREVQLNTNDWELVINNVGVAL